MPETPDGAPRSFDHFDAANDAAAAAPSATPQALGPIDTGGPRKSLGPRWDWLLELCRQIYKPVLGGFCVAALINNYFFAQVASRLDEGSLVTLVGLALALAGLRTVEVMRAR